MFTNKPDMKYMACWQLGVIDSHHADRVGQTSSLESFDLCCWLLWNLPMCLAAEGGFYFFQNKLLTTNNNVNIFLIRLNFYSPPKT